MTQKGLAEQIFAQFVGYDPKMSARKYMVEAANHALLAARIFEEECQKFAKPKAVPAEKKQDGTL